MWHSSIPVVLFLFFPAAFGGDLSHSDFAADAEASKDTQKATFLRLRAYTKEDYLEECTCGCCEMQHRKPSEIQNFDAVFKCSRTLSGTCGKQDQCTSVHNEILSSNTHAPLVYDQFCQLNCQPFDEAVSGACIRLSDREINKAQTDDGNGEDMHLVPQRPKVLDPFEPKPMPDDTVPPCEDRDPCIYRQLQREREKAKQAMVEAQRMAQEARARANLR